MAKMENILQLDPADLTERDGWNVRLENDPDNIAHIGQLAESIFNVGVLEPLTAYREGTDAEGGARYIVTNGHCRLAAVRQAIARGAPIKSVPVRLEPKTASEADHTFSMVARNTGKNLSQLELGFACKRLIAFGWSDAELAAKSGYSLQHVRNVLTLAAAPVAVTTLVETGQVSASLAVQAIAAEGEAAGETLTQAVEIAKEEAKADPKKAKAAKDAKAKGKPAAPVKATMKHVAKAKGKVSVAKPLAKKAPKQPELSSMMSDDKAIEILRQVGSDAATLATFEGYGQRKAQIFGKLLRSTSKASNGNGRDPDLTTLGLIFGRAVVDAPDDDGIMTLVMSADDWQTACKLLGIKGQDAPLPQPTPTDEPVEADEAIF